MREANRALRSSSCSAQATRKTCIVASTLVGCFVHIWLNATFDIASP